MRKLFALGSWIVCAAVLHPGVVAAQNHTVVVSTSMLEAAVREVLPAGASIDVVSILPPSSCPGHFDMSPRLLPMLKAAALVIRHDYQGVLDEKIAQIGGTVQGMNLIETTGSPLIPHHYSLLARHVSAVLKTLVPDRAPEMEAVLMDIDTRMERLAAGAEQTAAQWQVVPVVAATNAIEFCNWLGFTVVGELKRPEDTTPQDFAKLVRLDAELIVGNLQEGTESALSLGARMNVPVAVISNFPGAEGFGETYDDLFTANLNRIRTAWQRR